MTDTEKPVQGRKVDQNAGLGQIRVDEPGPGADQLAAPSSAGGPGAGSGDAAQASAGSRREGEGRAGSLKSS
jgi:hypothetical protein